MLPAHERFHANQVKPTNINLRLILDHKLRSFESRSQITFQHELFESTRGAAGGVELIEIATQTLGAIECCARILQQPAGIAAIVRIKTDPDTARYEDLLVF